MKAVDLKMLLATTLVCVLAVLASVYGPDEVKVVALPLAVYAAGALRSFIPRAPEPPPPEPPAPRRGGVAIMALGLALALVVSGCAFLRPKSVRDFRDVTCVTANLWLDVAELRAICPVTDLSDEDLRALVSAARTGAAKAGANYCGPAGAAPDGGAK